RRATANQLAEGERKGLDVGQALQVQCEACSHRSGAFDDLSALAETRIGERLLRRALIGVSGAAPPASSFAVAPSEATMSAGPRPAVSWSRSLAAILCRS